MKIKSKKIWVVYMNRYIFFLLFCIMTSPNIFLAMDDPHKTIDLEPLADSFEERILSTNSAINKMFKYKDPLALLQRPLTEKKALSILHLVDTLQENMIDQLFLKALMEQNAFFLYAINHYYELALKNIREVRCDTLEAVTNYLNPQPVKELEKLPPPIKKFVMKKAYAQVTCLYNINFEGHTNKIESIATNIPSNFAASASKDGTFRLWRLSNGQFLHTLDESAYDGYVKFNDDGSQLATATVYKHPNKTRICIWDTISRECLYTMKQKGPITHVNFFPSKTNTISDKTSTIIVVSKKDLQSLYKLKKDCPPLHLGDITEGIKIKREQINYAKEVDNYCWIITKNSRRLGVCEQALHNTKNKQALEKTTQIPTYAKLTDYEKDILKIKIEQKIEALGQKKPIQVLHAILG